MNDVADKCHEFQIIDSVDLCLKKTKMIMDMYDNVTPHYFVDMVCEEMHGNRKQITNTIPLDDVKRVGKVLAHMLDGVAEIENR